MAAPVADKIQMQNLLFSELSAMFGKEVPLYDKSLLVNKACNQTVCALLSRRYKGFSMSAEQLEKTSGERHGAIRIGKPSEYRWIAGFFAAFGMEPHNFYDMTNVGSKSQPIVATAFRSSRNPEHRIFCSLLMTDYFDPQTRERIETLLATREVFSDRAKELVLKNQERGGLDWSDARDLIREGVTRIFKWTGRARDYHLYQDLCKAGFKIAADIACFEFHHLNHLTPNTLCMDVYTNAMKLCLGEINGPTHSGRAVAALTRLRDAAGKDYMKLHFKHLSSQDIEGYGRETVSSAHVTGFADTLTTRLQEPDLQLGKFKHSGFKDFTEGPPADTPILLRQDAYKALTEPVVFQQPDGSTMNSEHTARFGEIEERFYATTPAGRALYDQCLAAAEAARAKNPGLAQSDYDAYQKEYAACFAGFPKSLAELLERKLVYGSFVVTPKGKAAKAKGSVPSVDMPDLVRSGCVEADGLRYEDFLPVSAAGIFASNLGQYGTKSTAAQKPVYTKETLQRIMERPIIDSDALYSEMQAESLRRVRAELGLSQSIPQEDAALADAK
jgi:uncharacterized glyoxalase superfamily metalloenzyme YdcJ